MTPTPHLPTEDELARWAGDGGAHPAEPVTRAEVLAVLDDLAGHVNGFVISGKNAANLAAAIRVRGLKS